MSHKHIPVPVRVHRRTQRFWITIAGCPAAFRVALSAARSTVVSAVHFAITAAELVRAVVQAATSRADGATSAACIAIAAASISALTL